MGFWGFGVLGFWGTPISQWHWYFGDVPTALCRIQPMFIPNKASSFPRLWVTTVWICYFQRCTQNHGGGVLRTGFLNGGFESGDFTGWTSVREMPATPSWTSAALPAAFGHFTMRPWERPGASGYLSQTLIMALNLQLIC